MSQVICLICLVCTWDRWFQTYSQDLSCNLSQVSLLITVPLPTFGGFIRAVRSLSRVVLIWVRCPLCLWDFKKCMDMFPCSHISLYTNLTFFSFSGFNFYKIIYVFIFGVINVSNQCCTVTSTGDLPSSNWLERLELFCFTYLHTTTCTNCPTCLFFILGILSTGLCFTD